MAGKDPEGRKQGTEEEEDGEEPPTRPRRQLGRQRKGFKELGAGEETRNREGQRGRLAPT